MKTSHAFRTAGALGALAVTQIALVSGASAQATAVQWKVADGGNGHWYRFDPTHVNWEVTRSAAMAAGGDLACVGSQSENEFVRSLIPRGDAGYIGAIRTSNGWQWVSGEAWNHESWNPGEPNGATVGEVVWIERDSGGWNDHAQANSIQGSIIEWSADCNSDGIVDYGQCLNGTLPDYNSNHVPDCCERGEACVASNYPVQWQVHDGGNGHWYQGVVTQTAVSWTSARARAVALGSQLASIGSRAEDDFVARLALENPLVWPTTIGYGPWLGGYQTSPSTDPFANWVWVTGEPWSYVSDVVQFDNSSRPDGQTDDYLHYINHSRVWNDVRNDGDTYYNSIGIRAFMAEWSADCNSDGIVDYGQILTGQLVDMNTTGIPDICEQPPCQDSDITNNHVVDGADLGALLAFWGPVNPVLPQADINRDGDVNGADLGLLLTNWGPCGQ